MKVTGINAASIFNPHKISGLSLWLDAADANTITATSNQVTEWRDKSASNFHVSQGNTTFSPITNSVTQNGLNTISFDGVDDVLSNASNGLYRNVPGFGLFIVTRTASTAHQRTFTKTTTGTFNNRAGFAIRRASTKYEGIVRRLDGDAGSLVPSIADTDTSWHTFTQNVNYTAGSNIFRIDKVQQGNLATTVGNSSDTDGGVIAIGAGANLTSNFFNGQIAEIVSYSKVLSADETDLVEDYLSKKWAI
jgi:hypothetical protein